MKNLILFVIALGVGAAGASFVVSQTQSARHAAELATQRATWNAEKAGLESDLAAAKAGAMVPAATDGPLRTMAVTRSHSPKELLDELTALRVTPGQTPALRRIVSLFDQLVQAGSPTLSPIREVLASGQDVSYETAPGGKGRVDLKALTGTLVPPSLRLGLFDAVRQIGGPEAEKILADSLNTTSRGIEIACLSQCLEQVAPGKYRDVAIAAAQKLLAGGAVADARERELLFAVLGQFSDSSFAQTAQTQLFQADGKLDRSVLKYLRQAMGEQSIPLAAQAYQSGTVTDADSKEPLGRLALNYVGANQQAAELYHQAIMDPTLKPDQRRELVEDLNQDGISSERNPTPEDLKIISNRYALTQAYLQQDYVQTNRVLNEAFKEADKDLRNMLERAATNNMPR